MKQAAQGLQDTGLYVEHDSGSDSSSNYSDLENHFDGIYVNSCFNIDCADSETCRR